MEECVAVTAYAYRFELFNIQMSEQRKYIEGGLPV